jgi:hypothetical protein
MSAFGKIGGISGPELIIMEQEFTEFVDFKMVVDTETFNAYVKAIRLFS